MILLWLSGICGCSGQATLGQPVTSWAEGATWYQIFPERFRNGNLANDPVKDEVVSGESTSWQVSPWTSDWYKLQDWEKARSSNFYDIVFDRRYGGDLIGVLDKLDYLADLGIEVLYFNPIFEAPSLHKYDASTYHHVDNNFGLDREGDRQAIANETEDPKTWTWTNADSLFLELVGKAHDLGIRIVIDGVFNHCGREFWAFRDVVRKQQNSVYRDWFEIISWDDPATPDTFEFDYEGWWGYKGLPLFREDENGLVPPVREYVFNITRRWMDPNADGNPSDGVDGWRLDAAPDVNPKFWVAWNKLVKALNPEALTVAEIWEEAGDWLRENRFDSTMNYPVAYLIKDFFIDKKTRISVSEFERNLARLRTGYPEQVNHLLLTLVDSHDTDRVGSMILNPDRDYDQNVSVRYEATYNPRRPDRDALAVQKLIALFQFTYVGAPMIYYGDEAGMWGADDPDNRKPMLWQDLTYENESYLSVRSNEIETDASRVNDALLTYYRKLTEIRKESRALLAGNFQTVLADDVQDVFAFRREVQNERVTVVLNNAAVQRDVDLTGDWASGSNVQDLLTGTIYEMEAGRLALMLPAKSGLILK